MLTKQKALVSSETGAFCRNVIFCLYLIAEYLVKPLDISA